jgi:tellurite resistance protein
MLDWNQIKNKANELYEETTKKMKQYTPEAFSRDKQLVNSIVITMVLMTIADGKVETKEVMRSLDLIKDIEEIRELDMVQEAIELYEYHLQELENLLDKDVKLVLKIEHLLMDIAKIKDYEGHKDMIITLMNYIAQADGEFGEAEEKMKERIIKALGG